MRKLLIGIGTAVAVVTLAASSLVAQRGPGRGGPGAAMRPGQAAPDGQPARPDQAPPFARGGRGFGPGFGAGLGLSDEQRAQVQTIMRDGRDQSGPIEDQLQLAQRSLHREVFADHRDDSKVGALAKQVQTLRQQLMDLRIKTETRIAGVLTPEQLQKMRVMPRRPFAGARRGGPGGPAGPAGPARPAGMRPARTDA